MSVCLMRGYLPISCLFTRCARYSGKQFKAEEDNKKYRCVLYEDVRFLHVTEISEFDHKEKNIMASSLLVSLMALKYIEGQEKPYCVLKYPR